MPGPTTPDPARSTEPFLATDPTKLTTDAVNALREQMTTLFDAHMAAAESLTKERFRAVETFLAKVEEQRVEQKSDTKTAVDAALAAQKEAIIKTEAATGEALRQLKVTFDTAIAGITLAVAGLTERIGKVESVKVGAMEQKTETRAITAGQMAAIGLGITVVLAVLAVLAVRL